jgi:putative oxidoreductase
MNESPSPALNRSRLLLLILRLGLGALFVVAGGLKLRDPAAFAQEIANYQLLPALAPYLALALPTIEIVAGVALLLLPAPWQRAAALALAGLLAMFTVATLAVVVRGVNIECGCFGAGGGPVNWSTVLRDLALIGAAMVVLAFTPRSPRHA